MAGLFSISHMTVTGASGTHWALFTLLMTLPGLVLGWVYLRTGTLWLPVGIHFAWNLFQGDVFNLSGAGGGPTLFGLITRQHGPSWIMGTSYGIEVGLAGVLAVLLVAVGAWAWTTATRR